MAVIIKSESEWMSEVFFCANGSEFQHGKSLRWLPSSSWVRMNEWSCFVQNGWIQEAELKMADIYQIEWEWMSLSQIELVWVRVLCKMAKDGRIQVQVKFGQNESESDWISLSQSQSGIQECFWVNLREDNKVSESKMAVPDSNMEEFKMAAIIKLSQNEWVKFFFCAKWLNPNGRIQDGWHYQVEWEWMRMSKVFFCANILSKWMNPRWQNSWWQKSRWLPSSRMNKFE